MSRPSPLPTWSAALEAGSGKRLPDLLEVVAVAFEVFERDPPSFSIDHHRSTLRDPLFPG